MNATIYTTAPADYDWRGTRELSPRVAVCKRGKAVRRVTIPEREADAQCARYHSGAVYMVADQAEFDKLVKYRLVTLAEEASCP